MTTGDRRRRDRRAVPRRGHHAQVAWTADHALVDASPTPTETRDRTVVWNGPSSFGSAEPHVELGPPGADALDGPGADAGAGGASATRRAAASPDVERDPVLLGNEERVLRLLELRGGRMKQRTVADGLGWTDAKTSRVTKGLREDGEREGFRLGRENVLALPVELSGEIDDPIGAGAGTRARWTTGSTVRTRETQGVTSGGRVAERNAPERQDIWLTDRSVQR